jgi:hypothetical protein
LFFDGRLNLMQKNANQTRVVVNTRFTTNL